MKKTLKITGIVLASLLGLALIVLGIVVGMISSSERLTKMVKQYAPQFITCQMELGKADLTLFKTFPEMGVDIENVALINPMAGSLSDTLASINHLIVVVDAKKFIREREIVIRKCILQDAFVNLYTDKLGNYNFSVFDTGKDDDTTSTPFDYLVNFEEVKLKNTTLFYSDDRVGMETQAHGLNLDLKGRMQDLNIDADLVLDAADIAMRMKSIFMSTKPVNLSFEGKVLQLDQIQGLLKLTTPDINLNLSEPYLENDTLSLNLPLQFSLKDLRGHLDKAQVGLNRYLINIAGDIDMPDNGDVNLDLALSTNTLVVEDVLSYLPQKVQERLRGFGFAGKAILSDIEVKGTYNDSLMPLISTKVVTDNMMVNISQLPYPFTQVNLDGKLELNFNTEANSFTVNSLSAKFNRSSLTAEGLVDDLLGDVGLKLKVKGDVPMSDIKSYLPKNLNLQGRTNLDLVTNFTYAQLDKSLNDYNLNRLSAKANLRIKDFVFDMDTIHAVAPVLNVGLTLPTRITLATNQLDAQVGKGIKANLKNPDIKLTADHLKGGIEKMLLNADLKFGQMDVIYDSLTAHIDNPAITFVTSPDKNSKGLNARVTLDGKEVAARLGKDFTLNTNSLKVDASVKEDKAKTDFLNQWNPTADFFLGNAVLKVDGIDEDIRISSIDFLLNSHELDFKKSTIRVGQSDLSLRGNVVGIKEWLADHKNLLKGELQVTSDMVNINEILDLTSGLGTSDEEPAEAADENKEDNPFMVPEGVDFNFVLNTKRALYDNFDLDNLNGTMTVKDGTLILREIGFTNKAAEMQLTAMYQSPRKNNLFLAMDFHLLNVQINDLLHMVPFIDTLVPMLKTFDGQAEFHIGAETSLKSNYEPKISTLRAAADIEGRNLTVNDHFTFTNITDKLGVSTNGEYRVDSLDVQMTVFKDKIDLWPSQIAIGKYKVTVDGRMTLDKNGEYHLTVTETPILLPNRMGLKLSGPINNLEYELESPKFPTLYKPSRRNDTEQMYYELKKKIADRLKENVR